MYPVTRLLLTFARSRFRSPLAAHETSELSFICRPWDLDMYAEMNNGRILTLYDIGRFDLSIRCGLLSALFRRRWGFAVAGSTIQYRKRIRLFNKVTTHTKLLSLDEKWIFVEQSMWVRGAAVSSVLLRTCVTGKTGVIPTEDVMEEMGLNADETARLQMPLPDWAANWQQADKDRPWPPLFR
ncbi:MAG: thioeseterase [Rhodomicrobium sp.]|nr:MAG: thioeseterase [Rhodomicrobium sp.]